MTAPAPRSRSAQRPSQLLERSDHLAELGQSLAAVQGNAEGRLLFLAGEAGGGKTALLRQFCADNRRLVRILWGNCDSLITPRPLGPLLDIAHVAGGELERLIEAGAKPHEVTAALARELRTAPSILVLEDLHWADDATLDLLRLLGRRIESMQALIVASYRDDELDRVHPLRVVLGELASQPGIGRMKIEPLSSGAVSALAELSGIDASELYGKTGGNPFFVSEILAAGDAEIPNTVRDAVLGRAAGLSDAARTVLEAVAVVPPHAEIWLLEELAGAALERLEECLATGMLRTEPGGVAFRHELARRAIDEAMPPDRKLFLHRKVVAALTSPPTGQCDDARLSHHAEAAGDAEAVLRHAPAAAARAISLGAHREAAAQYARALRFGEGLSPEARADLFDRRSRECFLTDQFHDAIDAVEQALAYYRTLGDRRRQGAALCSLSRTLWCPGRTMEARSAANEAVAVLESLPPGPELAMAYSNLSAVHKDAGDAEETIFWGTRAVELATSVGDVESLVRALINVGVMNGLTPDSEGSQQLHRALELAEEAELEELVGLALVNGARASVSTRSYAAADDYLDRGLRYCAERGLELFRLYLLAFRARFHLDQGHWSEATDCAALVLRVPRISTVPRIYALVVRGLVQARRGDPEHETALAEALALAEPSGELQRIGPAVAAAAEAAWLAGGGDAVADITDAAMTLAIKRQAPWMTGELAYWRWRAGIREQIPLGTARPYALQISGDWEAAAKLWAGMGCPYEAAVASADSGRKDEIRSAFSTLIGLDATATVAALSRDLRARGVEYIPRGPRTSTRSDPAGLTLREGEVLDLIEAGSRNAEIAELLSLSERTVAHHVSSILMKLGVTSRGAAPVKARELRER